MGSELESKRSHLYREMLAVAVALGDHFTSATLCNEFQNLLGYSLVTAVLEAGYVSVDDMLSKSPEIQCSYIQAKKRYKVENTTGSEATRDITALIKMQGKKKKKNVKINTAEREYLNRNVNSAQSFRGKSTYGAGFVHPFCDPLANNVLQEVQPVHGPPKGFKLPQCSRTTSAGTSSEEFSAKTASYQNKANAGAVCCIKPRILTSQPLSGNTPLQSSSDVSLNKQRKREDLCEESRSSRSPAVGVERFLRALRFCGGIASADQLRTAYRRIHDVHLDGLECVKYFGKSSTREVVDIFLNDVVEIVKEAGRSYFVLLDEFRKAGRRNMGPVERISRAELYDGLTNILVEIYPKTLHVDSLTELFLNRYGVVVDPEETMRLSWEKYISKFFSGHIEVDIDGNVSLNINDPLLNDKVIKKSAMDALEVFQDSDSSFDATDSNTVTSCQNSRQSGQRPESPEGNTVHVDHSREGTQRDCESTTPLDRNMKISRCFHGGSKVTAFFECSREGCSDVAGADLRSTGQGLSRNRRLSDKTSSAVGNFHQPGNRSLFNFKTAPSRTGFPLDRCGFDGPKSANDHSLKSQEDVECSHPYFNVHFISKSGDARLLAARTGLSIKNESTARDMLI